MKYIDAFFHVQFLGLQRLSHLILGKPVSDDEVRDELRKVEKVELLCGKTTLRGDLLRLQVERRKLRDMILAPRS